MDRLETEIQSLNPGVRFVDLETDRGRQPVRRAHGLSAAEDAAASADFEEEGDFDPGPVSEPFETSHINEHDMSEQHMREEKLVEKDVPEAAGKGGSKSDIHIL